MSTDRILSRLSKRLGLRTAVLLALLGLVAPAQAGSGATASAPEPALRSGSAYHDAAIERRVRLTIKDEARFLDTTLEVEVRNGRVRVRGMLQDPIDLLALRQRIESLAGVVSVEFDAVLIARQRAALGAPGGGSAA